MYESYKKNAFTLIELLAVILILGIIALIAIPTVNKLLDEAKKGAFESSLNNIEKIIKDKCNEESIKTKSLTNHYTITNNVISPSINIKGKLPNGKIIVDNNCNVTYELSNNNYLGYKDIIKDKPIINKCNNNCKFRYEEPLLNGATPKLESGMIPVNIDNNGVVKKADIFSKWYEYGNNKKEWANAILVKKSIRNKYTIDAPGTIIANDDILAYLVWIPRFRYSIPSNNDSVISGSNGAKIINIKFENKVTTKSNGNAIDENYYTHPAFTFGNNELNGIWVGKFETTTDPNSICTVDEYASYCQDIEPTILPNIPSLRSQEINYQYNTSLKFMSDEYGITVDSHMMKNSEWGAVAYLAHSIYGIGSEIRENNNNNLITGCGASVIDSDETDECNIKYGQATEYPQSTTGNISGIFDMSGGAYERVMSNYNNIFTSSELIEDFGSIINKNNYDLYITNNNESCNNYLCKGHAEYETKNWYSDGYYGPSSDDIWVVRGGCYYDLNETGTFYSATDPGGHNRWTGFRMTFLPEIK